MEAVLIYSEQDSSIQLLLTVAGAAIKRDCSLSQPGGIPQGHQGSSDIISTQEQIRTTWFQQNDQHFPAPVVHSLPYQRNAQSLGISKQNANTQREQYCKSSQDSSFCATLRASLWNMIERDHESSWVQ